MDYSSYTIITVYNFHSKYCDQQCQKLFVNRDTYQAHIHYFTDGYILYRPQHQSWQRLWNNFA